MATVVQQILQYIELSVFCGDPFTAVSRQMRGKMKEKFMGIKRSERPKRFELKAMSPPPSVVAEMDRLTHEIESQAFSLFERRGAVHGFDISDWLLAESQIARPIPVDIEEVESEIVIRAEVQNFKPEDLFVIADSFKVKMYGRRDGRDGREQGKRSETEIQPSAGASLSAVRREIELPAAVDSDKAFAQMANGLLELHLPKADYQKVIETAAA